MNIPQLSQRIYTDLLSNGCLIKKNTSTALSLIETAARDISFQYNFEDDFKFINTIIEQYSTMFFEEKLTKRALSYFRNNQLGGDITDSDFEDCLQDVTVAVYQILSSNYKIRINLYLNNTEDEEEDTGIISYIYLRARQSLFNNTIEYNKTVSNKSKK